MAGFFGDDRLLSMKAREISLSVNEKRNRDQERQTDYLSHIKVKKLILREGFKATSFRIWEPKQ